MRIYVLDGGGPKDSENTPNSFLTKCGEKVFWQIGLRALERKCSMDNYCNLHRDNSIEDKGGFALMDNKIYNQLAYTKGLDSKG